MLGKNYIWQIAYRYLRSKRDNFTSIISLFSFLGIMLGVATLIIVMSVLNGYHKELMRITLGFSGHVIAKGGRSGIDNYQDISQNLSTIPGIVSVNPMIERQVMLSFRGIAAGAIAKAMDKTDIQTKKIILDNIKLGSINFLDDAEDVVLIGEELAIDLHARVGDYINIISTDGVPTIIGTMPRMQAFQIGAIFKTGMYAFDKATILMQLPPAQIYFRMPAKVEQFEIYIDNPDNAYDIVREARQYLPKYVQPRTWKDSNGSLLEALQVERSVMFLILTLIIIIASFNIISNLIMLVSDKQADIAILRTLGLSRKDIIKIFFICGSSVGVLGTILGIILGLSFSMNIDRIRIFLEKMIGSQLFNPVIYYLSHLPSDVQLMDIIKVSAMSFIIAALATLYPAIKAAKINPAESLKNA